MDCSDEQTRYLKPYSFDRDGKFRYSYNIHYFNAAINPVQENFLTILAPRICVGEDLVKLVGKELNIMPESLQLFGLFWGNLTSLCGSENVAELVHEMDSQSALKRSMTFRRLSFDPDLEKEVVEKDPNARDLLFWEAASMHFYHQSLMLVPSQKTRDFLDLSKCTIMKRKSWLFNILHNDPSYWKSHYSVKCVIHSALLATNLLKSGSTVRLGMGYTGMTFYDEEGTSELASITWDVVYSVEKLLNNNMVIIKVLSNLACSSEYVLRSFLIESNFQNYIYSIIAHLFKIRSKRAKSKRPLPPNCKFETSPVMKGDPAKIVSIVQEPVMICYNQNWNGMSLLIDDDSIPAAQDANNDTTNFGSTTSITKNDMDRHCQSNELKQKNPTKTVYPPIMEENKCDHLQKLNRPEQKLPSITNSVKKSKQSNDANGDYFTDLQRRCAKKYFAPTPQPNIQTKELNAYSADKKPDRDGDVQSLQSSSKNCLNNSSMDFDNDHQLCRSQLYTNRYFTAEFTFSAGRATTEDTRHYTGEMVASRKARKSSSCSSLYERTNPISACSKGTSASCLSSIDPTVRAKSARYVHVKSKFNVSRKYHSEGFHESTPRELQMESTSPVPSSLSTIYFDNDAYLASASDMSDDVKLKAHAEAPLLDLTKKSAAISNIAEIESQPLKDVPCNQQLVHDYKANAENFTAKLCNKLNFRNLLSSPSLNKRSLGFRRSCSASIVNGRGRNTRKETEQSQYAESASNCTELKDDDDILTSIPAPELLPISGVSMAGNMANEASLETDSICKISVDEIGHQLQLNTRSESVTSDTLQNNYSENAHTEDVQNKTVDSAKIFLNTSSGFDHEMKNQLSLHSSTSSMIKPLSAATLETIGMSKSEETSSMIKPLSAATLKAIGMSKSEETSSMIKPLSAATLKTIEMSKSEEMSRGEEQLSLSSFERLSLDNQAHDSDNESQSSQSRKKHDFQHAVIKSDAENLQTDEMRSLATEIKKRPLVPFHPHPDKITFRSMSGNFDEFVKSNKQSPLYDNKVKLKKMIKAESCANIKLHNNLEVLDEEQSEEQDVEVDEEIQGQKFTSQKKPKLKPMKSCPIKLNELENKSKDRKRAGIKHSIISGMKASNGKTSGRKRCKKELNEFEINNEDVNTPIKPKKIVTSCSEMKLGNFSQSAPNTSTKILSRCKTSMDINSFQKSMSGEQKLTYAISVSKSSSKGCQKSQLEAKAKINFAHPNKVQKNNSQLELIKSGPKNDKNLKTTSNGHAGKKILKNSKSLGILNSCNQDSQSLKRLNSVRFQNPPTLSVLSEDKQIASLSTDTENCNKSGKADSSSHEDSATRQQLEYIKQTDVLSSQMVNTLHLMNPCPIKMKTYKESAPSSKFLSSLTNQLVQIDGVEGPHRIITVSYHPEQVVYVQLKSAVFVTAEMVKQEVGKALGIEEFALEIFGLFKGKLGNVTRLLGDSDVMQEEGNNFVFLRRSFHKDSESQVLRNCQGAVDVIFSEFRDRFEGGKLIPEVHQELMDPIIDDLKTIDIKTLEWEREHGIIHERLMKCPHTREERKAFVFSILESSEVSYNHYYKVDRCTTRDILVYIAPRPHKRMEISITLNLSQVEFLHSSGKVLHSIPWELIKSIQLQLQPKPLVLFEVLICEESYCVYKFVTIRSRRAEFIFSIANYILEIYSSMPAKPVSSRSSCLGHKKWKLLTPRSQNRTVSSQSQKNSHNNTRVQSAIPAKEGTDPFSYTDAMGLLVYGIMDVSPSAEHASSSQLKYNLPPIPQYRYCLTTLSRTKKDSFSSNRPATAPAKNIRALFYQPLHMPVHPQQNEEVSSCVSLYSRIPETLKQKLEKCEILRNSRDKNINDNGRLLPSLPAIATVKKESDKEQEASSKAPPRLPPIINESKNTPNLRQCNNTPNLRQCKNTTYLVSTASDALETNLSFSRRQNLEEVTKDQISSSQLTWPNSDKSEISSNMCDLVSSSVGSEEEIHLIDHDLDSSYEELAGPVITSESQGEMILFVPHGNESLKRNTICKSRKSLRNPQKTETELQRKSSSTRDHLKICFPSKNKQKSTCISADNDSEMIKKPSPCSSSEDPQQEHCNERSSAVFLQMPVESDDPLPTKTGDAEIADVLTKSPKNAFSEESLSQICQENFPLNLRKHSNTISSRTTPHERETAGIHVQEVDKMQSGQPCIKESSTRQLTSEEVAHNSKSNHETCSSDYHSHSSMKASATQTLNYTQECKIDAFFTCKSFPIHEAPESESLALPSLDQSNNMSSFDSRNSQLLQSLPSLNDELVEPADDESESQPRKFQDNFPDKFASIPNASEIESNQNGSTLQDMHKFPLVQDESVISPNRISRVKNSSAMLPPPYDNTPPKEPGYPGYVCVEPPPPYERPQPIELDEKTGSDLINDRLYIYKRNPLKHAIYTPQEDLHDHTIGQGERYVCFNPRYSGGIAWEDRQIGPKEMHHATRKWKQWKLLL